MCVNARFHLVVVRVWSSPTMSERARAWENENSSQCVCVCLCLSREGEPCVQLLFSLCVIDRPPALLFYSGGASICPNNFVAAAHPFQLT
jgi:hypothetical protein